MQVSTDWKEKRHVYCPVTFRGIKRQCTVSLTAYQVNNQRQLTPCGIPAHGAQAGHAGVGAAFAGKIPHEYLPFMTHNHKEGKAEL